MSYLVLARKYRPRTFDEVVGQEVLKRTLTGAIEEGRVGHAYLFCGPRGTGKTTSARILAKALNCEQGPTPTPCGTCERCRSADDGSEADLIEIDAASNTGVDDVRALRDQASYVPLRARYKIYIVDEVHMLSRAAFNALLKTLEEPPAHVKFLFATTEPHKLPDTIVSRCQVLRLEPLPEARIAERLDWVFEREGVRAEEGVSLELARRARGGMRDALSLADQLLSLVGLEPRSADLARLAGETGSEAVERLLGCVAAGDAAGALRSLPATEGREGELLDGCLDRLRAALLGAVCGADHPLLAELGDGRERAVALAKELGAGRLQAWLEELLAARERMQRLPARARLVLELTLLDLSRPEAALGPAELAQRLEELERRLAGGAPPLPRPAAGAPDRAAPQPRRAEPRSTEPRSTEPRSAEPRSAEPPTPEPRSPARAAQRAPAERSSGGGSRAVRSSTAEAWTRFLEELRAKSPSLGEVLAQRGKLVEHGRGRAVIKLANLRETERPLVEDGRNRKLCARAFGEVLGEEVEVVLEDASSTRPGRDDPFTRRVASLFEGRVEDEP